MEKEGIDRKDITVLCLEKQQVVDILESNPEKYFEGAFPAPGKINVATVHSFKGLENKFILICGPYNYDTNNTIQMSLIYIANTRATAQSVFFINKRFEKIIVERITNTL
jgi:hypothetical protein